MIDSRLWTRRQVIASGATLGAGAYLVKEGFHAWNNRELPWDIKKEAGFAAQIFIGSVKNYSVEITTTLLQGFKELCVLQLEIQGKIILLKPNLVEPQLEHAHINTHPLFVRAVAEAFLRLGAAKVLVAEGAGHRRDSSDVLERSGLGNVLKEDGITFTDLNYETGYLVANQGKFMKVPNLILPELFQKVDWIVSLPKLKTHHWAGTTLSMKNLFGVLPSIYYGWPKNVLHYAGIQNSILDITATVKPHFSIVDGIVGMEGDGPIMGTPVSSGVIVMGRNPVAVDATATRLMKIDPVKISYLKSASGWLGPIGEANISQRGENVCSKSLAYSLDENYEAMRGIRL